MKNALMLVLFWFCILQKGWTQCENAEINFLVDFEMLDSYFLATPSGGMVQGSVTKLIVRNAFGEIIFTINLTPGSALIRDVYVDNSGGIYICGHHQDMLELGNGFTFYGNSTYSVFLAKYSPNGTVLWAHSSYIPGQIQGYDAGTQIAVDDFGKCYVSGYFSGEFQLDSTLPAYDFLTPQRHFLACADATTGEFEWITDAENTEIWCSYPHPDGGVVQLRPGILYNDGDTTIYDPAVWGFFFHFGSEGQVVDYVSVTGDVFSAAFGYNNTSGEISMLVETDQEFIVGDVSNTCFGGTCLHVVSVDPYFENIQVRELLRHDETDIPFTDRMAIAQSDNGDYYVGLGLAQESDLEFYNLDDYFDEGFFLGRFENDLSLEWYTYPGTTESNDAECRGLYIDEEGCFVFVDNSCADLVNMHGTSYPEGNFVSQYSCDGEWCAPDPVVPDGIIEAANDDLKIWFDGNTLHIRSSSSIGHLKITDIVGRVMFEDRNISSNNNSIPASSLAKGVYVVRVGGEWVKVKV